MMLNMFFYQTMYNEALTWKTARGRDLSDLANEPRTTRPAQIEKPCIREPHY